MTVLQTVLGVNAATATTAVVPTIGSINSYDARGGALAPVLPPLTGLNVGATLVIEKNYVDTTTNAVTATCYSGDKFDDTTTSVALVQAKASVTLQVVSPTTGVKRWKVVAANGNQQTLVSPTITGGTLDGVTIGGTTPATSITANTVRTNQYVQLSGTSKPFLNQTGAAVGTMNGHTELNYLAMNDKIVNSSTSFGNWVSGLLVAQNVMTPAVGPRIALYGSMVIESVGTNTASQAQYVGTYGRAQTSQNLGGTSLSGRDPAAIGSLWSGSFYARLDSGATYLHDLVGVEIDVAAASGTSVVNRYGLIIANLDSGTVQGYVDDTAINISNQLSSGSVPWKTGILFGRYYGIPDGNEWPFNSSSTIIDCGAPGLPNTGVPTASLGNPANIGIDFSTCTFTDSALKTGKAPITMAAMTSAPDVNDVQTVSITGTPTGGTFTLTFSGQTTTAIAYNASATTVANALIALSNIGNSDVTVTSINVGGPYTVTFTGTLANAPQAQLTATSSLSGGITPAVSITRTKTGKLYVASDGSLHYRGPTTDTRLAPA